MTNKEATIEKYLLPFDKSLVDLATEMRIFLKQETKPSYELIAMSTQSLNIGYGFTRKAWDCYCAIIIYSRHINLSFPSGASLSDPNNVLIGKGKRVRHIKVNSIEELKNPIVYELIQQAKKYAIGKLEDEQEILGKTETYVKPIG